MIYNRAWLRFCAVVVGVILVVSLLWAAVT